MSKKYLIRILIILILSGILLAVYFLFSPEESDYFPKCVFHTITGWDCPGCGSQRAVHHLLHFRIKEAFLFNPLLVCIIPYLLLACYFEYFGGKERFPRTRKILFGKRAMYIILIILVLFWILRNIFPPIDLCSIH